MILFAGLFFGFKFLTMGNIMNAIQLKHDELISVESQLNKLRASHGEADFDFDQWTKLTNQREAIQGDIETLKKEAEDKARLQASAFQMTDDKEPIVPLVQGISDTPHVYLTEHAKKLEDQKGYECAGELVADAIAYSIHGTTHGEGFKQKNERFKNYVQNTDSFDFHNASGTASTLDDGIEIIPQLLEGIRERGPGTFRPVLDIFNPITTARKEVDFYLNEDVYNQDGLVTVRVDEGGTLAPQKFTNKLERMRTFKTGLFASNLFSD